MALAPNEGYLEGFSEVSKISCNPLSSSWIAYSDRYRKRFFIKTNTPGSEIPTEQQVAVLSDSYQRQRKLRCGKFLTAQYIRKVDTGVQILYPYLNADTWRPISPDWPPNEVISLVSQMALILDFLHSRHLVHCDIKLSNFMVKRTGIDPLLILTDLEFLAQDGQDLQARLMGAPGHIAPEIKRNDRVDIRSDNYSLGVAVNHLLDSSVGLEKQAREALVEFVSQLTSDDYRERPTCLINALHRCGVIDESKCGVLWRKLLSLQMIDSARLGRSRLERGQLSYSGVFQDNSILGVSGEFLSHLDEVSRDRPHRAIKALRNLVDSSALNYDGQFWTLTVNDAVMLEAYARLDDEIAVLCSLMKTGSFDENKVRLKARKNNNSDRGESAFLLLSTVVCPEKSDPDAGFFVKLAGDLGRSGDMVRFMEQYVDGREDFEVDEIEYIYKAAKELLVVQRYDEAERFIQLGLESAKRLQDTKWLIKFKIYHGLCYMWGDRPKVGFEMVKEAEEEARRLGYADEEIAAGLVLYQWMASNDGFAEKERLMLRLEKRAAMIGSTSHDVPIYTVLALVTMEQALYNRSVKYCKVAIKGIGANNRRSRGIHPYNTLVNNYARLGEYGKSAHWCEQARISSVLHNSRNNFYLSQLNRADMEMARGRLRQAESLLLPLIETGNGPTDSVLRGLVSQNLGEISALRGEIEVADRYLSEADIHYKQAQADSYRLRVRVLRLIAHLPKSIAHGIEEWKDCLRRLCEARLYFHVSRLLCYTVLYFDGQEMEAVRRTVKPARKVLSGSAAPVMKAASVLLNSLDTDPNELGVSDRCLKQVYAILDKASQFDLTGRICELLAARYRNAGNYPLSRKFFRQALSIIRPLDNESWRMRLEEQIREVDRPDEDRSRLVNSFEAISGIVRNIGDASQALDRLIRFAAEVTGAERAVLMVRSGVDNKLSVIASYDCDEPSLKDVVNISSSVSMDVFKSDDPVLIDEALVDPRTKEYKSIVRHNIQSVVCVPLPSKTGPAGVLYLDHHTIPALFDEADLAYIRAMANFVSHTLTQINRFRAVTTMNRELREQQRRRDGEMGNFIGEAPVIKELLEGLPAIAVSNAPVLILGESGTGKQIIANMIHNLSPRAKMPLVTVNSSAIPENLAESELFGTVAGAATDLKKRDGKITYADRSTLFLDEIGDMPLGIQAKILHVVENNRFSRLGSNRELVADVRYIFATNADLLDRVKKGLFRNDLYYRISTIMFEIPPLRNRISDIPLLVDHFLRYSRNGSTETVVDPKFLNALMRYDWPGNVRELKNVIDGLVIRYPGRKLTADLLTEKLLHGGRMPKKAMDEAIEAQEIRDALAKTGGNRTKAARLLNVPRTTLLRKMKKYGIQ